MVTTLNRIDPDLYARLMSLSDGARSDVLEFLGAVPSVKANVDEFIDELSTSIEEKYMQRTRKPI